MSETRCPECGSWDARCGAEFPQAGCGCRRCAAARIATLSAQIARLREAIEPFRERLLVKRRGPFSHGVACPAEDTDTDNVACTCGAWDAIDRLAAALADPTGANQEE